MKIKKFSARTFSEALAMVKKELSQDAVILATEEKKGFRPHVVVTAAVDYEESSEGVSSSEFEAQGFPANGYRGQSQFTARSEWQTGGRETQNPDRVVLSSTSGVRSSSSNKQTKTGNTKPETRGPHSQLPAPNSQLRTQHKEAPMQKSETDFTPAAPYKAYVNRDTGADSLRTEISGLRSMIESMKNSGYEMALPVKKRAVLRYLRDRSIREEYAFRLCDKTAEVSELPLLISSDIRVKRGDASRKAVMLIGPTGVGKTTTIAKLAARALKAGKKAAIVNLDTYRIGAMEQARIYARILGIPLATASNAAELRACIGKFSADRDIIFIDTMGRNPRDAAYINEIAGLCGIDLPIEVHLLMSAASDDASMIEAYRSYRALPIDYLGFSKLDEAVRYGSLYNLLLTYQKPVAWLTTGQSVPGDIEPATVKRLASLITTE